MSLVRDERTGLVRATPTGTGRSTFRRVTRALLHPVTVVILAGALPLIVAHSIEAATYEALWSTPKFITRSDLLIGLALCAALAAGSIVGVNARWSALPARGTVHDRNLRIVRASRMLMRLGLGGYLLWFAIGVARGLNVGAVLATLSGGLGAISTLKDTYLRPVGGVTTFSQLAPAGAALGLLARRLLGAWPDGIRRLFAWSCAAVTVRAFLYGERLALVELVLPLLVVAAGTASPRRSSGPRRARTLLKRSVAAAAILAIYPVQEYYRTWLPRKRYTYEGSFANYIVVRLSGYYSTAVNNSSIAIHLVDVPSGYVVLRPFYELPLIGGFLTGADAPFSFTRALNDFGNPEFNNIGGLLAVYADIGPWSLLIVAAAGFVIGHVYSRSMARADGVLVLYGALLVGMVEMTRIPYFATPRGLVAVGGAYLAATWIGRGPRRDRSLL